MSPRISLQARINDYLAERRRLGFQLRSRDTLLADFAHFVADRHHQGPLTVELMTEWARQGKGGRGSPATWAARLEISPLLSRSSGKMRILSGGRAQMIRQGDHPLQSKLCSSRNPAAQGRNETKV